MSRKKKESPSREGESVKWNDSAHGECSGTIVLVVNESWAIVALTGEHVLSTAKPLVLVCPDEFLEDVPEEKPESSS